MTDFTSATVNAGPTRLTQGLLLSILPVLRVALGELLQMQTDAAAGVCRTRHRVAVTGPGPPRGVPASGAGRGPCPLRRALLRPGPAGEDLIGQSVGEGQAAEPVAAIGRIARSRPRPS